MTAGTSLHVADAGELDLLHVAHDPGGVDIDAARRAAGDFLAALGIDVDSDDLRETPARMARAYAELFSPQPLRLTTFANDEGYDELVLARGIPFRTVCEHHLLPFSGVAHVGYLPGERIVGLSKLARLVEHFAARPAGPGAADQAGGRLPVHPAARARRGRGARGRALLHDAARRPGARRQDGHLGHAGDAAGGPAQPGRVLCPGRRAQLRACRR